MSGPAASSGPARLRTPEEILRLDAEGVDELLERLEAEIPVRSSGLVDVSANPPKEAVVFGDTHGDWRSTIAAAEIFLATPRDRCLIGLGDYIDRAPADCAEGSVANSLYLLQMVAEYPGQVVLIQGNHETTRRFPVLPQNLAEEVDDLWGPEVERYSRLLALLERGPVAGLTTNGVYLAHGGFPRADASRPARESFVSPNDEVLMDIVWGDCAASRVHRGITAPFDERDLTGFLERVGAKVFLRGHDPDLTGRSVFHDRCLTLHTCRLYERYGGVLVARLPLDRPIRTTKDVTVEHLATEGKTYPEPW